ncbi:MAG: transposase family protein [Gammaproteobacteria bacterium]|nr:transposase family protein [Gammaproteobacteria bacterium]
MSPDDALFRARVRVFATARELGNVRAACRFHGIHPSTYYRWSKQVERFGLEILRPRERRRPRMPNTIPSVVEGRVVAFSLGHPGFGPARISAELARPKWGGLRVSNNGVWRILRRHGLSTRRKRLSLIAGYASPPGPEQRRPRPAMHLAVNRPGELVQMDCLYIGRLTGAQGAIWQYTAIDVASAYTWAELHASPRNPSARWTSRLARRVAADLARKGWPVKRVMTDNAAEFRSGTFQEAVRHGGAKPVFIHAGRPQTNGCVERVQGTILEECWKPAFARYLIPKITGLRRDLRAYLRYYNDDRAHTGRWNRGRTPRQVLGAGKMYR